jgi:superfamily II DNA/RNA helicase
MQETHEREELGIQVFGMNEYYEPLRTFSDLKFYGRLKRLMDAQDWKTPTRIQSYAIPIILKNKGLIGVSATGSGKTLAYVLPLTYLMDAIPNSKTLVLAPTRELSKQIANEFNKLMPKDVGCVYGGIAKYLQQK